ncbi:MAG: type II secretion system F family protein [Parcubacteria group bacterium]
MNEEKITEKQLKRFTWLMALMIESGLPLVETLDVLADDNDENFLKIITKMNDEIKEGSSLADAMRNANVFPEFYVEMIGAGEVNGILDTVLNRIDRLLQFESTNELIRFSWIFGSMLSCGIPIITTLDFLKKMFNHNEKFANAIGEIREHVSDGGNVYDKMKEYDIFPKIFWKMVMVGEKTGALDQMLVKYAVTVLEHEE